MKTFREFAFSTNKEYGKGSEMGNFTVANGKVPEIKPPEEYNTKVKQKQKESDDQQDKDDKDQAERAALLNVNRKVTFVDVS